MAGPDNLRWAVRGSYFEACNCLPICPCRQVGGRDGGRSTFGICDFALSWWIRHGHAHDVDLSERRVVMAGRYDDDEPGSPWTVTLLIDDDASAAQTTALTDIFLGRAGGTPSRNYAPAINSVAGVRNARIHLDHTRKHWSIQVNDSINVKAREPVAADETVACGIPGLDHPGEEVKTDVLRVVFDPPLHFEWSDRCGFTTDFDYRADD